MASRLYLPSSGTPAISPAFDPSWNQTTGAVRRPLGYKPATSSVQGTSVAETSASVVNAIRDQYISDPIPAATTISGTFKASTGARCSTKEAAAATLRVLVKVVNGTTGALKAILFDGQSRSVVSYPYIETHTVSGTLTDYTCAAGDRIVIERGGRFANTNTTQNTLLMMIGDDYLIAEESGVDYGDSYVGNDRRPWFEFSQDEIWGPNISRAASLASQILEDPVKTATKLASSAAQVGEKPEKTPLKLASLAVQAMIPRSGQMIAGLYTAGFPQTMPLVKLPDGRWVPLRPKVTRKPQGPYTYLVENNNTYGGTYVDVSDNVKPDDLIVFICASKRVPPRAVVGISTTIPGLSTLEKYRSVDDRCVMWYGWGAQAGGRFTAALDGADANRSMGAFVIRNLPETKRNLLHLDDRYKVDGTAVVFSGPMIRRGQVALFHTIAGNSSVVSASEPGWVFHDMGLRSSGTYINPFYEGAGPSSVSVQHSSGAAGLFAIIG